MSIVGPRPERPQFVEKFKEEIPRYMVKHQVRPGLTGWAQINGYRGDTSIKRRIEYDIFYIENWTMSFDIKIMYNRIWYLRYLVILYRIVCVKVRNTKTGNQGSTWYDKEK